MLEAVFADVSQRDTQFIFHESTESELPSWLRTYNVDVIHKPLSVDGLDPFVTIKSEGDFVGTVTLDQLDTVLTPPITELDDAQAVSEGYRVLFGVLNQVVFSALDREHLLSVSREIEERAYRLGKGTLRVCFQTFSKFRSQLPVYRHLAKDTDLDIHIYAVASWEPPVIEGITYHDISGTDLDLYWLLAFDDDAEPPNCCGLFARDNGDNYTGYWTDDREIIHRVITELENNVDTSPISAD